VASNADFKMSTQHKVLLLAISFCLSVLTILGQAPPRLPVYEVRRTATPIKVDGKLDDAAWIIAPTVGKFVNNSDGSQSQYKTEARVLYDDNFLYFSFRCADNNIWSTMKRRDEHLWEEEVVEVFLQADPGQPSYIELEVNPLGTMLDIYLLGARKPLHYESWNSEKLQWAVQVDGTVDGKGGDHGWTCEIALPMEDIVTAPHRPPQPGDRWRMNLYRGEQLPKPAGLAWSPTLQDDFHIPKRFGEIVFR
jgi:Carbohydrate-binding family 9